MTLLSKRPSCIVTELTSIISESSGKDIPTERDRESSYIGSLLGSFSELAVATIICYAPQVLPCFALPSEVSLH